MKNGNYRILFSNQAEKDKKKLKSANLEIKTRNILNLLIKDPFFFPPSYEKLTGDLKGLYSRRINIQHRIIYKVDKKKKEILIYRMWTHYEK